MVTELSISLSLSLSVNEPARNCGKSFYFEVPQIALGDSLEKGIN